MSDLPAPLTTEAPAVVVSKPDPVDPPTVAKPSDLGTFAPMTLGEMQLDLQVLQSQVKALAEHVTDTPAGELAKKVDLLSRQMDYLSNTYIREPHFPRE